MERATLFFLAPPPWALGRGQQFKYHLISITKSISKIFIPNFVCVVTNERYKTYQTGFFILSPGSCPRDGTCSTANIKALRGSLGALSVKKLCHIPKL